MTISAENSNCVHRGKKEKKKCGSIDLNIIRLILYIRCHIHITRILCFIYGDSIFCYT